MERPPAKFFSAVLRNFANGKKIFVLFSGTAEQGRTHYLATYCLIIVGKILKIIGTYSAEREAKIGTVKGEIRMIYIEALDFVVHFIDLRFNQPNIKACEQLELLLLEVLAALASNDFANEIEYLKLIMVIVSSCYCDKGVFQQSNELDPRTFFRGLSPRNQITFA